MSDDLILSIHSLGETRIPPEDPTPEQIKVYINDLFALEGKMTVAIRFEIGNTVQEMNPEWGDRRAFCVRHFGEYRAGDMLKYANIARQWDFNQAVGWHWSYYKEGMRLTRQDKEKMVKLFKQDRLKSLAQMKELIDELQGFKRIDNEDEDAQQIVHVDYSVQPDNNTIEVEYKPVAPALPPPPNTVNPGPWCAVCGDPIPDGTGAWCEKHKEETLAPPERENPFIKNPPLILDPVSTVGFKVEGQSVERVTYAPPAAVLKQSPPISTTEPVAVAFNPHTGIITYQACAVRKVQSPQGFAALAVLGDGRQIEVFIPCTMMPEED